MFADILDGINRNPSNPIIRLPAVSVTRANVQDLALSIDEIFIRLSRGDTRVTFLDFSAAVQHLSPHHQPDWSLLESVVQRTPTLFGLDLRNAKIDPVNRKKLEAVIQNVTTPRVAIFYIITDAAIIFASTAPLTSKDKGVVLDLSTLQKPLTKNHWKMIENFFKQCKQSNMRIKLLCSDCDKSHAFVLKKAIPELQIPFCSEEAATSSTASTTSTSTQATSSSQTFTYEQQPTHSRQDLQTPAVAATTPYLPSIFKFKRPRDFSLSRKKDGLKPKPALIEDPIHEEELTPESANLRLQEAIELCQTNIQTLSGHPDNSESIILKLSENVVAVLSLFESIKQYSEKYQVESLSSQLQKYFQPIGAILASYIQSMQKVGEIEQQREITEMELQKLIRFIQNRQYFIPELLRHTQKMYDLVSYDENRDVKDTLQKIYLTMNDALAKLEVAFLSRLLDMQTPESMIALAANTDVQMIKSRDNFRQKFCAMCKNLPLIKDTIAKILEQAVIQPIHSKFIEIMKKQIKEADSLERVLSITKMVSDLLSSTNDPTRYPLGNLQSLLTVSFPAIKCDLHEQPQVTKKSAAAPQVAPQVVIAAAAAPATTTSTSTSMQPHEPLAAQAYSRRRSSSLWQQSSHPDQPAPPATTTNQTTLQSSFLATHRTPTQVPVGMAAKTSQSAAASQLTSILRPTAEQLTKQKDLDSQDKIDFHRHRKVSDDTDSTKYVEMSEVSPGQTAPTPQPTIPTTTTLTF